VIIQQALEASHHQNEEVRTHAIEFLDEKKQSSAGWGLGMIFLSCRSIFINFHNLLFVLLGNDILNDEDVDDINLLFFASNVLYMKIKNDLEELDPEKLRFLSFPIFNFHVWSFFFSIQQLKETLLDQLIGRLKRGDPFALITRITLALCAIMVRFSEEDWVTSTLNALMDGGDGVQSHVVAFLNYLSQEYFSVSNGDSILSAEQKKMRKRVKNELRTISCNIMSFLSSLFHEGVSQVFMRSSF